MISSSKRGDSLTLDKPFRFGFLLFRLGLFQDGLQQGHVLGELLPTVGQEGVGGVGPSAHKLLFALDEAVSLQQLQLFAQGAGGGPGEVLEGPEVLGPVRRAAITDRRTRD